MSVTEIKPLNKTTSNQLDNNKLPKTHLAGKRCDCYGKREKNRKKDPAFALKGLSPTKRKFIRQRTSPTRQDGVWTIRNLIATLVCQ